MKKILLIRYQKDRKGASIYGEGRDRQQPEKSLRTGKTTPLEGGKNETLLTEQGGDLDAHTLKSIRNQMREIKKKIRETLALGKMRGQQTRKSPKKKEREGR